MLGVSKKYKSFATSTFNNIGENNTPFDYYSNTKTVDQILNEPTIAPRYLSEPTINNIIDDKRNNINNNFWSSYNALHKLGNKGSIKTNLYYLRDEIKSEQQYQDNNIINGQSFITSEEYFINKKPIQYRGDVEIKLKPTISSLLEYRVRYKQEKIISKNSIIQNKSINFNSNLETNDDLFDQRLSYTNRITDSKAIMLIANYSSSTVPQLVTYSPAIINPLSFISNAQFSSFQKSKANFQSILFGNGSNNLKYKSSLTLDLQNVKYKSELKGLQNNNSQNIIGFNNDIDYKINLIGLDQQFGIIKNKLRVLLGLNFSIVSQNIIDKINEVKLQKSNFLIQPLLNISVKTGLYSKIIFSTSYKQRPFNETNFVTSNVL